ncbi:MAG: glutathione S-transferase family protein [Pseudomonadota bacterium]
MSDDLTLVIGNKDLSSWSLRPWLALKHFGIPFREKNIQLDTPASKDALKAASPSGLVPCLYDGDLMVWDSLAILEYLNDRFAEHAMWPEDQDARAHARCISAEMHSGFSALRTVWPMMFTRENLNHLTTGGVGRDIARVATLWTDARQRFGSHHGGPFLYGAFSIADAMYAPVASRFRTYGPVNIGKDASAWMETILSHPAMLEWGRGAEEELNSAQ